MQYRVIKLEHEANMNLTKKLNDIIREDEHVIFAARKYFTVGDLERTAEALNLKPVHENSVEVKK